MAIKITMPSGGQTTDQSMITKWHKQVGDPVKKGDVLFEMETDKATMEIASFADGVLLLIKYPEGESVLSGEAVAYIGDEGEKLSEESIPGNHEEVEEYQPIIKKEDTAKKENLAKKEVFKSVDLKEQGENQAVLATPAARFLAKQKSLDIKEIHGNTVIPGNVVRRADIENYSGQTDHKDEIEFDTIEITTMRRTIARRMQESVSIAPSYTVSVDIDMTCIIDLRRKFNEYLKDQGMKVSFNDIIMKCVAKAIEKNKIINSSYGEDRIRIYRNVNIGLAVGLEHGLLVPVVHEANKKSIIDIAKANCENIEKARNGVLASAQMSGGTITLSSLGMFGVDHFTAIINQPESCILAAGSIIEKPVVLDGVITQRPMMNLTATFDHRVIDGAVGAAFLKNIKELMENSQLLLL